MKVLTYEVSLRGGGLFETVLGFVPLSASVNGESLFIYGLGDANPTSHVGYTPTASYLARAYGSSDETGDDFSAKDYLCGVDIGDAPTQQRLLVFARRVG